MHAKLSGQTYTVTCERTDVMAFAAKWPEFGPAKPITYEFDLESGTLVDLYGETFEHDLVGVAQLGSDARHWAVKALNILTWH